MNFDLRFPLGLMFGFYGVVLGAFGLFGDHAIYQRSLGININLLWGAVMLAFAALMLLLAFKARNKQ